MERDDPRRPSAEVTEDAPDPDEDYLDDLDDVLDEFSALPKVNVEKRQEDSSRSTPLPSSLGGHDAPQQKQPAGQNPEDELSKHIEAGMAELLGELESSPEMRRQFESLVNDTSHATVAASGVNGPIKPDGSLESKVGSNAPSSTAVDPTESFQETIQRTMHRMQQSGEQATAAATASTSAPGGSLSDDPVPEELLLELIKQLQASEAKDGTPDLAPGSAETGLAEDGDEEEVPEMLLEWMEQLTNKDVMYEHMKELHERFPGWLGEHRTTISEDERTRYDEQMVLVREIVERFERAGYSDDNAEDREWIVERMQKIVVSGSPPPDLVGNTSARGAAGEVDGVDDDVLKELDAACHQQ